MDADFEDAFLNDKSYSLCTPVPGSQPAPPRSPWHRARYGASWAALLVLTVTSSAEAMDLLPLSFLLACFLVGIGCITAEQAWRAIKYRVPFSPSHGRLLL